MNRWSHKVAQYKEGLQRINELVMLNLAIKEPEVLVYNPEVNGPLKPGQVTQLDTNDPLTYITYAHFPPPLPIDKIVLLNELAQKISMGLESKAGALRALGEEFPDEKLREIRSELVDEAKSEGALNLMRVQVQKQIMDMTGMMAGPDGTATPIDPMLMGDGSTLGDGQPGPTDPETGLDPEMLAQKLTAELEIRETLLNEAYNEQLPMRSTIDKD
jgi:hypothetical protein